MRLILNIMLVVIAAVYLPLGVMHVDVASKYWWAFASVVLTIAVVDFVIDVFNHLKDGNHA